MERLAHDGGARMPSGERSLRQLVRLLRHVPREMPASSKNRAVYGANIFACRRGRSVLVRTLVLVLGLVTASFTAAAPFFSRALAKNNAFGAIMERAVSGCLACAAGRSAALQA